MMAMTSREKQVVFTGAGVIVIGLLIKFAIMPFFDHWSSLRTTVSDYEQHVQHVEQKLNRKDAIVDRQKIRFGPGVGAPLKPVEQVQIEFPQAVQKALAAGGLGVSSVEPQGVRKLRTTPGVVMVSTRVRCAGRPDSLPKALAEIQKADSLIIVDSFDLAMTKPGDRKNWSVTMLVSTPALEAK